MRSALRLALLGVLWLAAAAHADALPQPVADALRAAGIAQESVGVFVQEAGAAQPLLDQGADAPMSPASVMKLVTTYAGLEMLGPAHTWETEVYRDGTLDGDTLQGDLILKGHGAPKLSQEDFWMLLRHLRQSGIRHIHGDVVLDGDFYDVPASDPGAFDGEASKPYNVAPEALLVNFQVVAFRLVPDADTGRVLVSADPNPARLVIENRLRLDAAGSCEAWSKQVQRDADGSVHVAFDGALPASCGEKTVHLALFANTAYLDGVFRQFWREVGGSLDGTVRTGSTPPGARLVFAQPSAPLGELVRDINKFSNNTMARALYLDLGAHAFGAPATPEKSANALRCWLAAKGLAFPELIMENGSGLSRVERISPRHLGELLLAAYQSPAMPEFVASLPVVALDGTMKKRLRDEYVARMAHVKTGTLDGVKAIAGYVRTASGRYVVVVCLINHPRAALGGPAQDALLDWVYQHL
jgi:D-alanyl-D-alanine carboxypeptidase/D-alanyl-D-alanine-endopeptidase (penicillin-binding protein 4)